MARKPRTADKPSDPEANRFVQTEPLIELGPDEVYQPVPVDQIGKTPPTRWKKSK